MTSNLDFNNIALNASIYSDEIKNINSSFIYDPVTQSIKVEFSSDSETLKESINSDVVLAILLEHIKLKDLKSKIRK